MSAAASVSWFWRRSLRRVRRLVLGERDEPCGLLLDGSRRAILLGCAREASALLWGPIEQLVHSLRHTASSCCVRASDSSKPTGGISNSISLVACTIRGVRPIRLQVLSAELSPGTSHSGNQAPVWGDGMRPTAPLGIPWNHSTEA